MPTPQFDIVFRGVREGFDLAFVKSQFVALFKLNPTKVDRIFKSKNVTLKHHADERLANIFVARLLAIGVLADKLLVENIPSKAIYCSDSGESSTEASAMHQPVEFLYGENIRRIPFAFTGKGFEYFKLWIVNVLVCLLSMGILYPWAQVRSLRYFYQHTQFDQTEFHYTSNPQKIFLVQFVLMLYLAGLAYACVKSPMFFWVGTLVLIGVLPFYWFKRGVFQLQHSFYCDIGFKQTARLRDAYRVFLVWPLLSCLSLGLAAPYAIFKIQQYRAGTISLGSYEFSFTNNVKNYAVFLPSLLIAEFLTLICIYYREYTPLTFSLLVLLGLWLRVFVTWRVALVNFQWNCTCTKLGYFFATWDVPSYNKLILRNVFFCVLTLGLYWPWARVKAAEYSAAHLAFFANQRFKKWQVKRE
jgi:uncharacterized membrane protein YjgN (DUF898 family)